MLTGSALTSVLVLCASILAQTFTECNPLDKSCPPNPAVGSSPINCDFTKGACQLFGAQQGTTVEYRSPKGALFSIASLGQGPTLSSSKYIFFGRVDVELIASPGQGVVTSVVLQSSDLDEIDFEWIGGDNAQVQSNYFGKGDTTTYDRGAFHAVSQPVNTLHTYSFVWTSKKVEWLIDGKVVRTLNYKDAKDGSRYPQTPMQIKLGTWVGGSPKNAKGTIKWAGGLTDFSKAPFDAWFKSIKVVDYAGGDGPATKKVTEYVYGDKSGSWKSIRVVQ